MIIKTDLFIVPIASIRLPMNVVVLYYLNVMDHEYNNMEVELVNH